MEGVEGPLLALTLVMMVVGLVGSVVPGLPGVTLIFLSALLYALLTDFQTVGAAVLVLLFVFAAIAFVADFIATSYGARRFGASNWGTVGGAVGGIAGALVGALFLGIGSLFGLILGSRAGRLAPRLAGCGRRNHRLPGVSSHPGTTGTHERRYLRGCCQLGSMSARSSLRLPLVSISASACAYPC